jgi:hypothetical protein
VAKGCDGDEAQCDQLRLDFAQMVDACDAQTDTLLHSLKTEAYAPALKS